MRGARAAAWTLLLVVWPPVSTAGPHRRIRVNKSFISQKQHQLPGEQLGAFPDCDYERDFTLNLLTDREKPIKEVRFLTPCIRCKLLVMHGELRVLGIRRVTCR